MKWGRQTDRGGGRELSERGKGKCAEGRAEPSSSASLLLRSSLTVEHVDDLVIAVADPAVRRK